VSGVAVADDDAAAAAAAVAADVAALALGVLVMVETFMVNVKKYQAQDSQPS